MIVFVILHYMSIKETEKCVKSIITNCEKKKYKIVIVDNCSPNLSGYELEKKYSSNSNIVVLKTTENLGFAKGNNFAFNEVKKYIPDFIVVLNSDVIINDSTFVDSVFNIYEKKHFDVLGPDIYCPPLDLHQNPKRLTSYTLNEINHEIDKYEKKCSNNIITNIKCFLKKFQILKKTVHKIRRKKRNVNYKNEYENVILHGSCVIFSKNYLMKKNYFFNPVTFMYMEMEILDYECKRDNLKVVYSPLISVTHNHNASTNYVLKSETKKVKFMNENNLNSLKCFKNIIMKDREKK